MAGITQPCELRPLVGGHANKQQQSHNKSKRQNKKCSSNNNNKAQALAQAILVRALFGSSRAALSSRGIFAPSHGTYYLGEFSPHRMEQVSTNRSGRAFPRRGPPAKSTVGIRMDRQIARGVSRALDATPHSQHKVISLSASQIRVPPMKTSSPSSSTSSTSSILTMTGYSGAAHEDSIVTIIQIRTLIGDYLSHSCSNLMSGALAAGSMFRATGGKAEVFVDLAVLRLECSEDDGLASWPLELMGQSCRSLRTRGDGACAIHAAFGTGDATRQELRHEQPRGFLRGLLAHPLAAIRECVCGPHTWHLWTL